MREINGTGLISAVSTAPTRDPPVRHTTEGHSSLSKLDLSRLFAPFICPLPNCEFEFDVASPIE
jgi:hypothetical protein